MHGTFETTAAGSSELPEAAFETFSGGRSLMSASKEELILAAAELRQIADNYRAWARAIDRLALIQHLDPDQIDPIV